MPPQLLIKEIKIVDVEKFVEHLARHFEELGIDSIIHSPITKLEEKEIPRYIDHAKKGISTSLNELNWNRIWGLFEGDKVVGHLNLEGAKLDSMSHRVRLSMGLEINYRSQGFGRKILQCSLEWLSHQKSIEWLDLNVLSHNKRAIQFYENFGFKRISRVIDKFKINGNSVNDDLMSLNLKKYFEKELTRSNFKKAKSPLDPIKLQSKNVEIQSLSAVDWQKLADQLLYPGSYYSDQWGVQDPADMKELYERYLRAYERGMMNPLVIVSSKDKEIFGITSLMNIEPKNKMLEIGGTWIAQKWQKSFVNTEAKFELLKYCFEELNYNRVEFRIDVENEQSQGAIKRLGAHLDGIMKSRVINKQGSVRDFAFYSIIKEDWFRDIKENIFQIVSGR